MGRRQFDGKDYNTVIQKLETAWAIGCADAEAALFAGISKAGLCQFLQTHPEVAERKELLKEQPVLQARMTLYNSIKKGDGKLAIAYLERARKKEFCTRQEQTGPDGAPLTQAVARIYIPHNGRNALPAEPKPAKPQPKPTTKKPKAA